MTRLSAREMEVARLVAEDLADKEIAIILIISVRTVQRHLDNIAGKIGAGTEQRTRRRVIRRWVITHETVHETPRPFPTANVAA